MLLINEWHLFGHLHCSNELRQTHSCPGQLHLNIDLNLKKMKKYQFIIFVLDQFEWPKCIWYSPVLLFILLTQYLSFQLKYINIKVMPILLTYYRLHPYRVSTQSVSTRSRAFIYLPVIFIYLRLNLLSTSYTNIEIFHNLKNGKNLYKMVFNRTRFDYLLIIK